MLVIYYIKLFGTRADRHNGILMSLPLLVADTIKILKAEKTLTNRNIFKSVSIIPDHHIIVKYKRHCQKNLIENYLIENRVPTHTRAVDCRGQKHSPKGAAKIPGLKVSAVLQGK